LYISSQNTIDYYSIFLNDFNIELIENLALTVPTCFFSYFFSFFPKIVFFFFFIFLCYFFQNCFSRFYFLNIELIENAAVVFFFKTLWIATVFRHIVFFFAFVMIFFLELSLSILFFSYWAGWEFSFVVFFKHCGLLQCSPTYFFFYDFFKIIFTDFIIFNIELVESYNFRFSHETL